MYRCTEYLQDHICDLANIHFLRLDGSQAEGEKEIRGGQTEVGKRRKEGRGVEPTPFKPSYLSVP